MRIPLLNENANDCYCIAWAPNVKLDFKKSGDQHPALDERDNDSAALLRQRCLNVDDTLRRLWARLDFPASMTLAAVGGYGRGELYPASDIDLLILLPRAASATTEAKLEQLIGHFWDIGLEIGHSVRTIQECLDEAAADITIQTALLEARPLAGCEKLFSSFERRLKSKLDPRGIALQGKSLRQCSMRIVRGEMPEVQIGRAHV